MKRKDVEAVSRQAVMAFIAEREAAKSPRKPREAKATPEPRQALNIPAAAIIRSRATAVDPDFRPFEAYRPPRGVVPENWEAKAPPVAMDQWPGGGVTALSPSLGVVNGIIGQGWTFIGYAALSELTQIPEYRTISEIIATEATREWIEFQAVGDLSPEESKAKTKKIQQLEDAVKRYGLRDHFKKLAEYDGFMGRSHLYIDNGTDLDNRNELITTIGDGRQAISKSKVRKGKLKGFKVVEPVWTYPANYNSNDPLRDDWYNPTTWFVMAKEIHSTRLLRFVSREVPDILKPAYAFGGLALSQMAQPYINNWLRTRQSVADIVHAFSVMVLSTDLSTTLQADGNQLFARLQLFNNLRENKGVFVVNKDSEDFKNVAAPLGTLDTLQSQAQQFQASVARIPNIKLFGIQPLGLNADSDGALETFEQTINAYQESFFRPGLTTAIDFIQLSEFGEIDTSITFKFKPLGVLDEKEEAEVQKLKADTHAIYVDMGSVGQEEVRKSIAADPNTAYPGLDVDDMPEPAELPDSLSGEPVGARHILAPLSHRNEKEAA